MGPTGKGVVTVGDSERKKPKMAGSRKAERKTVDKVTVVSSGKAEGGRRWVK